MRTLRVAQFIDTVVFGGAEAVAVQLAESLGHHGFEVEIHHFGNAGLQDECRRKNIQEIVLPTRKWYTSKWTLLRFAYYYRRFLRERSIDLLHSHLFGSVVGGAFTTAFSRIGHVGTLHDEYLIQERPSRIRWIRLAEKLGTKLVTVSRSMELYFRQLIRFEEESFRTIYNGVDPEKFPRSARAEMRAELGLEDSRFACATVGRLVPLKKQSVLIEAVAQMKERDSAVALIIGDGPERAALERLAATLGVSHRVRFLGFRSDVARVLVASDCFTLTSDNEGLSCSILESMAAGLPAVVTDVGGNRELVVEPKTGHVIRCGDAEALAHRLDDLSEDRARCREMGEAARKRVKEKFALSKTVADYVRVYRGAIRE